MVRRLIFAAALAFTSTGCAAGIRTGFQEVHPAPSPVRAERVAVLPLSVEESAEAYREVIADSLLHAAERAHPGVDFISPNTAVDRLDAAGLTERFAGLVVGYPETGEYDRALLREAGQALGADHVLYLHVGYERVNEASIPLLDTEASYEADRQNLTVSAVLWDVREGTLAWEAAGRSTTRDAEYELPRSFHDVLATAAAQLAQRLPLLPLWEPEDTAGGGG